MAEITLQQQADWWCRVYAAMKEEGWLAGGEDPVEQVMQGIGYARELAKTAEMTGLRTHAAHPAHLAALAIVNAECRDTKCPWRFDFDSNNFKVGSTMVQAPLKDRADGEVGRSFDAFHRWVRIAVKHWTKRQSDRS